MSGFHTYFHWVDEAGEQQRLSSLNSGLRILEGMVPEREVITLIGDGYPFQYELTVAGLIEVYENAAQYRLRELTLQGAPVDAEARIAELRALRPGTIIHAREWDQS